MANTRTKEEIFELPVEERLRLIGSLWESIAPQDLPLSEAEQRLIDQRLEEHRSDPEEGVSLEEFRKELFSK